MASDSPEQLLDTFKAAALSVTKLYKTSAAAQTKARSDGYQDCLDDLLVFLDRENIGLSDGEGWRIRRWATGRLDSRETTAPAAESEDETEKPDTTASPDNQKPASCIHVAPREPSPQRVEPVPSSLAPDGPIEINVPSQDAFTFRSSHPYPQDLSLSDLALSDAKGPQDQSHPNSQPPSFAQSRPIRPRQPGSRTGSRASRLGSGAGHKRKLNLAELFDVGGLGHGKDMFGNGGGNKRNRQT